MNNFGVIELASLKTTAAPGWAYVPDTGPVGAAMAIQPTNRKRSRTAATGGPNLGDQSARQAAKVRKQVEALDRDCGKDSSIPLPARSGRGKHTPAVRKIMQSQKTFANHMDDFLAMQALADVNPATQASSTGRPGASNPTSKRPSVASKKDSISSASTKQSHYHHHQHEPDTAIPDADAPSTAQQQQQQPDEDPLLASRVPPMPSAQEIESLLAQPPLTYLEACGSLQHSSSCRYPTRVFCEICGYWGRVRCIKCGSRVCALNCLETHREECVKRYGL
ncbi:hypothetical protein CDD82_2454 [Ophiocordyceps australis]|uniref:HIT-type domain-containing protein n=1 Tax=Ophiocordyceps australis TaxID=1399860 RepID=A0A2C5XWX2_9HYPO|nr:hypothetical protein CDD82_2454 [Ophiocordyceps australis]